MEYSGKKRPGGINGLTRREMMGSGVLLIAGASLLFANHGIGQTAEEWSEPSNGGSDPFPIPWLDKNGSQNQSPGPGMEPSSIYHFKGHVARSNAFTGMGTDDRGNRIAFGAPSTDFSFMEGKYFAGRQEHAGTFSHI